MRRFRVGEPMTFTATDYKYIELNEQQIPYIAGTTMKVVELVEAQHAYCLIASLSTLSCRSFSATGGGLRRCSDRIRSAHSNQSVM
jgi:hypothetical protein